MLRQVVDGLASRPETAGVAVVSGDGLVIEHALGSDRDPDAVAALITTLARHAAELGQAAALGPLGVAVFDYPAGPVLCRPLPDGASLVVIAYPDADFGALLHDLRQHGEPLAVGS